MRGYGRKVGQPGTRWDNKNPDLGQERDKVGQPPDFEPKTGVGQGGTTWDKTSPANPREGEGGGPLGAPPPSRMLSAEKFTECLEILGRIAWAGVSTAGLYGEIRAARDGKPHNPEKILALGIKVAANCGYKPERSGRDLELLTKLEFGGFE